MRLGWPASDARLRIVESEAAAGLEAVRARLDAGEERARQQGETLERLADEGRAFREGLAEAIERIERLTERVAGLDMRVAWAPELSAEKLGEDIAGARAALARLEAKHALHVAETDKLVGALAERVEIARLAVVRHDLAGG